MFIGTALLVGIGVGVLMGWPIFTSNDNPVLTAADDIAAYDLETLCNVIEPIMEAPGQDEPPDQYGPRDWRLGAVGGLAEAAGLADPSYSALAEAGQGILDGRSQASPQKIRTHLMEIQAVCDSRTSNE